MSALAIVEVVLDGIGIDAENAVWVGLPVAV